MANWIWWEMCSTNTQTASRARFDWIEFRECEFEPEREPTNEKTSAESEE